jgi:hypothetical protein
MLSGLPEERSIEATELLGFDVTPRTYGARPGAAEDLGRDGSTARARAKGARRGQRG